MRTSTRIAGVLTGVALSLGGASLAAPLARADIPACTQLATQGGATPGDSVTAACRCLRTGSYVQFEVSVSTKMMRASWYCLSLSAH
ncbi:hypothetical protein AB0D15_37160, partial [Streptomyces sp. NPDC048551]